MSKRISITFTSTDQQFIDVNGEHSNEEIIKAIKESFEKAGYWNVEVDVKKLSMPIPKIVNKVS